MNDRPNFISYLNQILPHPLPLSGFDSHLKRVGQKDIALVDKGSREARKVS